MDTLFTKYWSKTNYRRVDIDSHNYPENFWKTLSMLTGESIERLNMMRLNQYEGYIDEEISHNGKYKWIVPGGHMNPVKNKFYNLRYCPECLKEAEYFKLEWRLLYVTICIKHKIYLHVDCPSCNRTIKLKHICLFQNISQCICGYDLKEAQKTKAVKEDIQTICKLNDIAKNGYFILNNKEWHSLGFFYVLRLLTVKLISVNDFSHQLEELAPKDISSLLTQAVYILEDWPDNFIFFCKKNKLTHRAVLLNNYKHVPFWFERGLDLAINTSYRKSEEEIDSMFKYLYKRKTPTLQEIKEISGWNFSYGSEMRMKWLSRKIS